MTYTYIKNKLVEIFAEHFGVPKSEIEGITTKDRLYQKYELDSLDEIELVMSIEEDFSVNLYEEEYLKCRDLDDLTNIVCRKSKPNLLQIQVTKQEKQIKALQEQLKEYNELKEVLKRIIK